MPSWALLALRTLIALALVGFGWWWDGPVLAMSMVAVGALLVARPILEVAGDLRHALRAAAWGELQGTHVEWHGRRLRVVEDVAHRRWVRLADVRAIVGPGSSDGALALAYPSGFRRDAGEGWLSEEALLLHLARTPGETAGRLRRWVEREIAHPAREKRRRLGIRVPPPEAPAGD